MNLNGTWELRIRPRVRKKLERFPRRDKEAIVAALEFLPHNPFVGDVEKMEGNDHVWRRRVGNYRIKYELIKSDKIIYVFDVQRRTSNTY